MHLPELVHDLRDIIQSSITAKRISLFIDMVDVEDEDVVADPMRLNQIMLNILSNAIKFTPVGGMITLRIVQKQTAPHGSVDYEFHIRDTGIGMSSAFQEHIFEQFGARGDLDREQNSGNRSRHGDYEKSGRYDGRQYFGRE